METILTIDFDIVMGPSIDLYNSVINENFSVEDFMSYNNLLYFCNCDTIKYSKILTYSLFLFQNLDKSQIHFIGNHHNILNFIDENKKYNIINIDHHHDCWPLNDNSKLNCGNWVTYLSQKNILNDYTWINNTNSFLLGGETCLNPKKTILLDNIDLINELPIPDKVVYCSSYSYIPVHIRPLYAGLMDLTRLYYHDTFFEEDFE